MAPSQNALELKASGSILLADDDSLFCESTAKLLEQAGYACRTVPDADALRGALRECEFDLVIADIVMPGNARLELLAEFGQPGNLPPLMLVTGFPSIETATRAVRSNVVAYLTKPFDASQFLETVRREVDAQQARQLIRRRRVTVEGILKKMQELEHAVGEHRHSPAPEALNSYLDILTESTLGAIHDLHALVEVIVAREGDDAARRRLEGTRPFLVVDGLREAIAVLERSKRAFKSKELADLRAKLEALLRGMEPPASRRTC